MKYSIKDFRGEFPNDDACLDYIFTLKYPNLTDYYRVKDRKCYENKLGHQIHPLAGTIFEKSSTPLTLWFHAIYLFSASKNGVSAKELERQLGVTYKTAWRIANQIRKLMNENDGDMLGGEVEVDETYVGGKGYNRAKVRGDQDYKKQVVMGIVERKGRARVFHVPSSGARALLPKIEEYVVHDTQIYSDEYGSYKTLTRMGYKHGVVRHRVMQFRKGDIHTQNIENFWAQLKRSIGGTYHNVSPKYLQSYADEFAFRYNRRTTSALIFRDLIQRV